YSQFIVHVLFQAFVFIFIIVSDKSKESQKSVVLDKKTDFFWKYNITNYVGKISYNKEAILFDSYEGRAEVFGRNFSLVLKNVKHSDSGDYAAVVVGGQEQSIAEYKVIVQDPVSRAELTVDHLSSSSDSCNLTVTCSTVEFNISSIFRCDAQNCLQVEEKSLNVSKYFYSLIVYLQQDTIFCNHSNKVSWKANKKVIKPYCERKSGKTISKLSPPTVVFSVGLIIMVIAVISVHLMEKKKKQK
uniref:Immunoglobulin subtype domain-containing protein n=1 Tax=Astatotilapia calliptera TaxID=8154 RepID=A0A3P8NN91_ASTCA